MMQPSGRAMHNGKVYELWGDELWEYSPDVETGETTVRVVWAGGNCNPLQIAYGMLRLTCWRTAVASGSCQRWIARLRCDSNWRWPPSPKPKGSTPTGNPKYPGLLRLLREFRLDMHECGRDGA